MGVFTEPPCSVRFTLVYTRRFSLKTLTALNCLLNYAQVCVAGSKLLHRVDATFKLFYRATIMVVTAKGASVSEAVGCFAQQAPRSNEG